MFLGLPFAAPPVDDLRWEKPIAWIPGTKKEIIANKFKPACFQNQRIVNWYKRLIIDFGGKIDGLGGWIAIRAGSGCLVVFQNGAI